MCVWLTVLWHFHSWKRVRNVCEQLCGWASVRYAKVCRTWNRALHSASMFSKDASPITPIWESIGTIMLVSHSQSYRVLPLSVCLSLCLSLCLFLLRLATYLIWFFSLSRDDRCTDESCRSTPRSFQHWTRRRPDRHQNIGRHHELPGERLRDITKSKSHWTLHCSRGVRSYLHPLLFLLSPSPPLPSYSSVVLRIDQRYHLATSAHSQAGKKGSNVLF